MKSRELLICKTGKSKAKPDLRPMRKRPQWYVNEVKIGITRD